MPDITLRSTFIVGFPGETDQDFEELLLFLKEAQLDRVGCFAYSAVDGAKANELPNPVDEEVKQERLEEFMKLQAEISTKKLTKRVGNIEKVLIDEITEFGFVARSRSDAPGIDGVVLVETNDNINVGDFVNVKIVGSSEHDLYGKLVVD